MSEESPEERVARLERELAAAKIENLERELAEARVAAGTAPSIAEARAAVHDQLISGGMIEVVGDIPTRRRRDQRPGPPADTNLSAPPRKVPRSFLLAELLPWNFWYLFTLAMIGVGPIALWMAVPKVAPIVGIVTMVAFIVWQFRNARTRLRLLRAGKVAEVEHADETSRGTYYSGTTYNNMRIPIAHGWKVTRDIYSGPKVVTRVRYSVDGHGGVIKLGGRGYIDGVILALPSDPNVAMCVTQFSYDLDRDANGDWIGTLRPTLYLSMAMSVITFGGWIGATIFLALRVW